MQTGRFNLMRGGVKCHKELRESNEQASFSNGQQHNDLGKQPTKQSVPKSVGRALQADSQCPDLSVSDPDLLRLLNLWSQLPDHIRAAINALAAAYEPVDQRNYIAAATRFIGHQPAEGGGHA